MALVSMTTDLETPFRVTDLKQWVYCPRILYYYLCLPDLRPVTYKMEAGIEAGIDEKMRQVRRGLKVFGVETGRKEFNVELSSSRLGLRGTADMVIYTENLSPELALPVDFKLSEVEGEHFKLQLTAYAIMLEENTGFKSPYGFLYELPKKKAVRVNIDKRLRQKVVIHLEAMQRMLWRDEVPEPTPNRGRCIACEFRRFCNDVR